MRRYMLPLPLRVALRLEFASTLTFWRTLRLSLTLTTYLVAVMYWRHVAQTGHWDLPPSDLLPLGSGEILGALAAVATGTIALQVMAQTAYSRQSVTLEEFSHRQTVMLLAFMGSTVSFVLAAVSWLGMGVGSFGRLANVLVVTTLAAINCFIAADAASRIHRVDSTNLNIQIMAARREVARFRRKRLPPLHGVVSHHGEFATAVDFLAVSVVMGTIETAIIGDWGFWPLSFGIAALAAIVVLTVVTLTAVNWFKNDLAARWQAVASCSLVLILTLLTILEAAPEQPLPHILVLLLLPAVLSAASLKTVRNRTAWLLPAWVPGSLTRKHAAARVEAAAAMAQIKLRELKKQRQHLSDSGPAA